MVVFMNQIDQKSKKNIKLNMRYPIMLKLKLMAKEL